MASKYTIGIYCSGIKEWARVSSYDHFTKAPMIIAVAESEEAAERWIEAEMARQEREVSIMPGHGYHSTYSTVSLDSNEAYLTGQNAARDYIDLGKRKKALLADPKLIKV